MVYWVDKLTSQPNLYAMNASRKILSGLPSFLLFMLLGISCSEEHGETRVLVFSKTTVFRHESIPSGIEAIRKLGRRLHFSVDTTENAERFNEENLRRYSAVIFLSTTGDVLNQ